MSSESRSSRFMFLELWSFQFSEMELHDAPPDLEKGRLFPTMSHGVAIRIQVKAWCDR